MFQISRLPQECADLKIEFCWTFPFTLVSRDDVDESIRDISDINDSEDAFAIAGERPNRPSSDPSFPAAQWSGARGLRVKVEKGSERSSPPPFFVRSLHLSPFPRCVSLGNTVGRMRFNPHHYWTVTGLVRPNSMINRVV